MNIKLNYQYRDGGNYKQHGEETFSNINGLSLLIIEEQITSALIEGEWFYAEDWNLPDLHLYKWDDEIDHDYHEYISVEETTEIDTQGDITDFIKKIIPQNKTAKHFIVDDKGISSVVSAILPLNYNRFDHTLFGPTYFVYEKITADYEFIKTESSILHLNLELINTNLSKVLAELLLTTYINPNLEIKTLISMITENNCEGFNLSFGHPIYKVRIVNFLVSVVYGMKPDIAWNGICNSRGIIITNGADKTVCYHIYNVCMFINYLFDCIIFEMAGEMDYREQDRNFIKLPLHIVFTERIFQGPL